VKLLQRVEAKTPADFEQFIVQLLSRMACGPGAEELARALDLGAQCWHARALMAGLMLWKIELLMIWLGRKDSNLRMPVPKTGALPLGYAPARAALYNESERDVKGAKAAKIAAMRRAGLSKPLACEIGC